jgi:hypothetical protein
VLERVGKVRIYLVIRVYVLIIVDNVFLPRVFNMELTMIDERN